MRQPKPVYGSFNVEPSLLITCDHNHVRHEAHFGESRWAHRKGATRHVPAVIPGPMGTVSYHVTGRGCAASLNSSSHGAGRALSRRDARRRVSTQDLLRQIRGVWIDSRLAARLTEEAPSAYKDIEAVFRAQKALTRNVRRLRPVLCYKGV